jgi:hypothetical protein
MEQFFDTEEFTIFDLVDECQPREELTFEAKRMLNEVDEYDDYSESSTDFDYD